MKLHSPSDEEEEMEHRRILLMAAANGDVLAQQELEREYHVRVYAPSRQRRNNSRPKNTHKKRQNGTC